MSQCALIVFCSFKYTFAQIHKHNVEVAELQCFHNLLLYENEYSYLSQVHELKSLFQALRNKRSRENKRNKTKGNRLVPKTEKCDQNLVKTF